MTTLEQYRKCRTTRKPLTLLFTTIITMSGYAQELATLEVTLDHPSAGLEIPVRVPLDPITHVADSLLYLVEVTEKEKVAVPFQIESSPVRQITWLVKDDRKNRRYLLVKSTHAETPAPRVRAVKGSDAITLKTAGRDLLRYQSGTVYPPDGVNPIFKRSAFIHPLWSPHGQILTRIQPRDHYHHYGLWNPWTHVLYDGDTIDFWNLNARQGTVRFANLTSVVSGEIFAEYSALHEHVVLPKQAGDAETIAMNEVQTVRLYVPHKNADYYIADMTIQLNCPEKPVRLLEYRYGGLGWRATEEWTKENSRVLTSEGKTRKEADGSKARWCIVEGNVDGKVAGAVMMSHPTNYNHPEPLRIWPENANDNRGDMFANFSPTKDRDWPLEPGTNHVLRYRFIVFDKEFEKDKAEIAWKYFASPPVVNIVKQKP